MLNSLMRACVRLSLCALLMLPLLASQFCLAADLAIPDEFTDPQTHLRVVHLSRVANDRSGVIYFTYPCITADSRLALIDTQFEDKWRHLYSFDFQTMAIHPLVADRLTQDQVVAPATGHLYYLADDAAWVIDMHGGLPRKIADIPARWSPGAGFSVNADETLLLGASSDVDRPAHAPTTAPAQHGKTSTIEQTFSQHLPNVLFTVNIKTGEVKVIHRINTWLGHVQFSPTDPDLLMFCHEGPWGSVERIWMMRLSKGEPYLLYKRNEPREIVGHEFWAPDGKSVWFQQDFRDGKRAFLTGQNLETGKLTQYTVPEGGRSIHYAWTPDGRFFIGDGQGKTATGPDKYLSLLTPEGDHLKVTHLCSLQKNDYAVEPNPHMSPDNRWVIFTATLFGTPQAYGVEVPAGTTEVSH
jgi:oligogalacturonide lyase